MADQQLGLTEAVSIALGGMIGGGIYVVLGVVTGIAGAATWAAFVLAAVVVGVELLDFERDVLAEEVAPFEPGETAE